MCVVRVVDAFDRRAVDAVLHHHGEGRAGKKRLADDHVSPRRRHAVRADADLDAVHVHRAVVAAPHVVFARPDQLDRRAAQALRDLGRLALDVRVRHGAPAEAAARHLGVKGDLLRLQSEHFGDGRLVEGLELRTGPDFRAVAVEPHGRVQRLHRRVRQVGELVLGDDAVALRRSRSMRLRVAARDGDSAGGARELPCTASNRLRAVGTLDAGEVPFDLQTVARLLRRPELVGDDGDAASRRA